MIGFIPGLATGVSGLMATPDGSSRERILPDMRYPEAALTLHTVVGWLKPLSDTSPTGSKL